MGFLFSFLEKQTRLTLSEMFHHIHLFIILFKIIIKSPTKGLDQNYPLSPQYISSR